MGVIAVIPSASSALIYCHVYQWLKTGFGMIIGFINNLQNVTTNNYYTIADLHNLQ
jgi:hypothetical protein